MEYNTPSLRKQLQDLLEKRGKSDTPITQTLLWWFAVQQAHRDNPKGLFFDDIQYINTDLPEELKIKPSEYPRVLVIGTKRELGFRTLKISTVVAPNLSDANIIAVGAVNVTENIDLSTVIDSEVVELCRKHDISGTATVTFCSQAAYFWPGFFLTDDFLDEAVSLPQLIISTENIRSQYDIEEDGEFGGSQHNITERLTAIAKRWNVPIEFLPSLSS